MIKNNHIIGQLLSLGMEVLKDIHNDKNDDCPCWPICLKNELDSSSRPFGQVDEVVSLSHLP